MGTDNFANYSSGLNSPASTGFSILPSDSGDFTNYPRAIYVGTGGHVSIVDLAGNTILLKNVQSGTILPVRAKQVRSTGTTAGDLIGLY